MPTAQSKPNQQPVEVVSSGVDGMQLKSPKAGSKGGRKGSPSAKKADGCTSATKPVVPVAASKREDVPSAVPNGGRCVHIYGSMLFSYVG
jgi:hypothetical protein